MSFENRELAADLKQSQGDASQALFADSIGQSPFKMAKQEAKPVCWPGMTAPPMMAVCLL
ncbi:MAG: hypothetical protein IPI39_24610 [Candidatus Obscuribacter sp.]|nr:hypothetical protein [Candidatus Obscuribacter sp.]